MEDEENKLFELEDAFKERLNKDDRMLFIDCFDARAEFNQRCTLEIFKQGFCMGCEFMREVLD